MATTGRGAAAERSKPKVRGQRSGIELLGPTGDVRIVSRLVGRSHVVEAFDGNECVSIYVVRFGREKATVDYAVGTRDGRVAAPYAELGRGIADELGRDGRCHGASTTSPGTTPSRARASAIPDAWLASANLVSATTRGGSYLSGPFGPAPNRPSG
jgi:hypothetical protein